MKYRFKDVIELLEVEELELIKQDIDKGGVNIKNLVKTKLKEEMKKHGSCCTTCATEIEPFSHNNFTLIFGPEDFKKKATFCAIDCMEYFLAHLKKNSRKKEMGVKDEPNTG